MRDDSLRRRGLVAAAVCGAILLALPAPARAEDPSHGHGVRPSPEETKTLGELTPGQRRAALEAFAHVVCDCPKENWSRTLANCPDACASPQKHEVIRAVLAGRGLAEIVAEQVRGHGPKAAAAPGTGADGSPWVWGLVAGGAVAALVALRRSAGRRTASARPAARSPAAPTEADRVAVERELSEVE